jgi:hypothetical protein
MATRRVQPPQYLKDHIKVRKLNPIAELPVKKRLTDVAYDVALIARTDNRAEDNIHDVNLFSTGLSLVPPPGYYIEVLSGHSLYRNGYMLATGVTIVDPENNSELIVPLYKFKDSVDLDLPVNAIQIVLKKSEYAHIASDTPVNRNYGSQIGNPQFQQGLPYNQQQSITNPQYQASARQYALQAQQPGNGGNHFY